MKLKILLLDDAKICRRETNHLRRNATREDCLRGFLLSLISADDIEQELLMMGQCFGTDCTGLCPRWALRKNRGFDRFTEYAPKQSSSRYGDDHLLNEYQDQQDELDFSGVGKNIYRPGPDEVVIDIPKDTTQPDDAEHIASSTSNLNYSATPY